MAEEAQVTTTAPESNPEAQAQALVQSMKQPPEGGDPAPQEIKLPEGLDPAVFNVALKEMVGVEDYTKLPSRFKEAERYKSELEQLQGKYSETARQMESLKAKAELSPFANPLVERINEYFKENRDPEEARRFLELHTLDVANLSGEAAYRQMLKMQNPGYSQEMVDRVIEKEFGPLPADDDPQAAAKLRQRNLDIEIEGTKAKNWLSEQTASFEDPKKQEQQARIQEEKARFSRAWGMVAKELAQTESELMFKVDDPKAGGGYYFGYKPKLDQETSEQLSQMVAQYAVEKQLPLTRESEKELQNYKEALLWNLYREDFLAHMARDMYSSMQKRLVESHSGGFQPTGGSEREGQRSVEKPERRFPEPEKKPGNRFF